MGYDKVLQLKLNEYRNVSESLNRKKFNPKEYKTLIKEPVMNPGEANVYNSFLEKLKSSMKDGMPNCPHKIYEDERHRIFQGNYFYYIEFENPKDVSRLIKSISDFADILTLEEHHQNMLKIYSERIKLQF